MSKIQAFETIKLEMEGGLGILTLNRPDKLNSFNEQMFKDLSQAFDLIDPETNPDGGVRCLLITGAGRGFCAGQDLGDPTVMQGHSSGSDKPDLGQAVEEKYNPLVRRIAHLSIPVVCAVNGVAAGAGSSIALGCDIVYAAKSASFIQSFCKIGLIPDSGGTWHLPRLVGRARALGLSLLGNKLPAEKAAQWGLIWECVEDEELMNTAFNTAQYLATQPTQGLNLIKKTLLVSSSHTLDEQLDLERDAMRQAGRTSDYAEGVAAFMEKRPPTFTGR